MRHPGGTRLRINPLNRARPQRSTDPTHSDQQGAERGFDRLRVAWRAGFVEQEFRLRFDRVDLVVQVLCLEDRNSPDNRCVAERRGSVCRAPCPSDLFGARSVEPLANSRKPSARPMPWRSRFSNTCGFITPSCRRGSSSSRHSDEPPRIAHSSCTAPATTGCGSRPARISNTGHSSATASSSAIKFTSAPPPTAFTIVSVRARISPSVPARGSSRCEIAIAISTRVHTSVVPSIQDTVKAVRDRGSFENDRPEFLCERQQLPHVLRVQFTGGPQIPDRDQTHVDTGTSDLRGGRPEHHHAVDVGNIKCSRHIGNQREGDRRIERGCDRHHRGDAAQPHLLQIAFRLTVKGDHPAHDGVGLARGPPGVEQLHTRRLQFSGTAGELHGVHRPHAKPLQRVRVPFTDGFDQSRSILLLAECRFVDLE